MNTRILLCTLVAVPLTWACSSPPSLCVSGLEAIAQDVATHLATKIPLNTQSDCAGASRPPFNDQAEISATDCAPDPTDTICLACLRTACCTVIGESCAATSAAACAAMDSVKGCIVGALTNPCATHCSGAQ